MFSVINFAKRIWCCQYQAILPRKMKHSGSNIPGTRVLTFCMCMIFMNFIWSQANHVTSPTLNLCGNWNCSFCNKYNIIWTHYSDTPNIVGSHYCHVSLPHIVFFTLCVVTGDLTGVILNHQSFWSISSDHIGMERDGWRSHTSLIDPVHQVWDRSRDWCVRHGRTTAAKWG